MLVLTFQVGRSRLGLDIRRVLEVVPRVELQPAVGSPPWLAGVFIYRAQVVPVLDLHRLLEAGDCPRHLSSRIILVRQADGAEQRLLGLLAAQVADIRDIPPPDRLAPSLAAPGKPDLGPVVPDGREMLHLLELDHLLPESFQRLLPFACPESPA
jgi:chemotaxis-related protein WspB